MKGHIQQRGTSMAKRSHGDGGIDQRGENVFRLRYRTNGKRIAATFHGTLTEARKELRRLLKAGDDGQHVDPSKKTLGQWIEEWLAAGAPGRKKRRVGQQSLERYEQVLNIHVKPALGKTGLQKLTAAMIDRVYADIARSKIAPKTAHLIHVVFGACLATAHRKGEIANNPMAKVEGIRVKPPKTMRGFRTIDLDQSAVDLLLKEKALHQRITAGIPDGVDVDLSLIKLPPNALIFPATPKAGEDFDCTKWRNPINFSHTFARRAEAIGFGKTRFHDLRGIHATALLDAGIPVHTVAQRIGDDPAILLRAYTKRKRSTKADEELASALASFSGGFPKP